MQTHKFLNCILAVAAIFVFVAAPCRAQKPSVMPKIQETPLPTLVQLPPPPCSTADVPSRPLSAGEAAQIALHNQPNVGIAQMAILAAQGVTEQNKAALLPSVVVTGAATAAIGRGIGGVATGSSVGTGTATTGIGTDSVEGAATLNQLIYDFDHTRDKVRQSVALEKAASAGLTKTQSDTVNQTKQAFYGVLSRCPIG